MTVHGSQWMPKGCLTPLLRRPQVAWHHVLTSNAFRTLWGRSASDCGRLQYLPVYTIVCAQPAVGSGLQQLLPQQLADVLAQFGAASPVTTAHTSTPLSPIISPSDPALRSAFKALLPRARALHRAAVGLTNRAAKTLRCAQACLPCVHSCDVWLCAQGVGWSRRGSGCRPYAVSVVSAGPSRCPDRHRVCTSIIAGSSRSFWLRVRALHSALLPDLCKNLWLTLLFLLWPGWPPSPPCDSW